MKKTEILKKTAALALAAIIAGTLAGCSKKKDNGGDNAETEETIQTPYEGTMPVKDGDVYAINKVTVPDPLPAGYYLYSKTEKDQGLLYLNGVSQIVIRSQNYKDDYQELQVFAENACATMKLNNMYSHCDTDFKEPENAKVAGFDAVRYDYEITQNEFVTSGADDTEGVKTAVEWYKSRAYFFYSDKDVYYIIFTTSRDSWDNSLKGFEEFMAGITIDENAENTGELTPEELFEMQYNSPAGQQ